MDFVTPIITPIVESLMVPIKKHLGFFFCSSKHVTKMHDRLLVLNDTAHGMESKKEINDANNLVIPNHVSGWLAQVKTVNEKAGSIPTNGNGCFNIKLRYKAGKESFDILQKIYDLEDQESKIKWTNEQVPLGMVISPTMPPTSGPVHDDDCIQHIFRSRQSIFKDVLKSLDPDSNTQKMALCGMGGVGKTTMMEELKKAVEKRGMFKWVLKVVIGQKCDPLAIQQAIAQYMGEALTETTRDARADRLGKRFEGMSEGGTKKILVILDDIWEEVNLKDIGLTSPLPSGFKLLVTTRDEKVCIKMDIETSSIIRMVGLEEAEANFLFWETVRLSDGDVELHKIGENILKKCGGLPIAIKTIALTLRGEKKDAWADALVRLQRHDLENIYAVVDDIFEISYNNLKKDDKSIFILCGLFPDDFDIKMEELMRYGWGLQLFKKTYSLVEARNRTNTSISNLIHANLLIESDNIRSVKMHDLARAFILNNISKFKQASVVIHNNKWEWPTDDTRESCERIFLDCTDMSEFPEDFNYPNLLLLKLISGHDLVKFPEDFYKRMEKLEVIAYEDIKYPLLPVSLQCSTSLRSLCLYSCSLVNTDISFLGDLINLEVLSLGYCDIQKLPSTIGKLRKLKLLDLTGCVDLCIEDGVFQNMDKLEELYMRCYDRKTIRFTDANCDELEMVSRNLHALEVEFIENILQRKTFSFKKLQRFCISIGCFLEYTSSKYLIKNTLKLVTNCSDILESKINELFPQTEELHLSVKDLRYVDDISIHPSQHSTFCNLKVLHVFKCADLTYLFTVPVANGLKKLERLTVSSCPSLKSLVSLCGDVNVVELPQLVELKLYELPNITSIFLENNISTTHSFLSKEVMVPKLSKLTVDSMKKLKHIWACDINIGGEDNVSMLREIAVSDCNCLVNLFPRNPMQLLFHLEVLTVYRCCSMKRLLDIDLGEMEQLRTNNSSLRRIEVGECDSLVKLFPSNPMRLLSQLEVLVVYRCSIEVLFDIDLSETDVNSLRRIKVIGCDSLVNLFPTNVLPSRLEVLTVVGCCSIEVLFNINLGVIEQLTNRSSLRCIYLDQLDNLTEVWRINDEYNSSLLIRGFQAVEYIVIQRCKKFRNVLTPATANFDMGGILDIRIEDSGRNGTDKKQDPEQEISQVDKTSMVAFPSSQLEHYHQLRSIYIERLKGVEVVFEIENPSINRELITIQQQQQQPILLLSSLENLELKHMDTLSHVWKCSNWKEFVCLHKHQAQSSFKNLTTIHLYSCKSIKYLFSPLMSKLLSHLKRIKIEFCDGMEEVVSNRYDNEVQTCFHLSSAITLFPHLDSLDLRFLHNLKHIGGCVAKGTTNVNPDQSKLPQEDDVSWSLGQYCSKIDIYLCHELSTVIPSYAAEQMQKLQVLCIYFCKSMVEVFETNIDQGSNTTPLIPGVKNITMHKLSNLKILNISCCNLLEYIFTFSTLESLKKLENLSIDNCNAMKVIAREENGEASSKVVMVFPCLKSIELEELPNLEGFFMGMNIHFHFPSLDYVMINDCPQMKVLTAGESTTPKLKHIHTCLGKHTVECGLDFCQIAPPCSSSSILYPANARGTPWSFKNLIEIDIKSNGQLKNIVPSNELLHMQNLEKILAEWCADVEEVFEVALNEINNESPQIVVELPKLREVKLRIMGSLKYLWKNTQCRILEFPNLTKLSIDCCHRLKYVFTASMVGGLMQLQELHISFCYHMKVIFTNDKYDAEADEIMFPNLKSLKLDDLPRLKAFSLEEKGLLLPSMNTLVIKDCAEIMFFAGGHSIAPKLKIIETNFGSFHEVEDINSFIMTKKQEGNVFGELRSHSSEDE